MVELLICNQRVGGSNPSVGSIKIKGMRREQIKAWEWFFLSIISLMFFSLLNCTAVKHTSLRNEAQEHLLRGQALLSKRNYDGALAEFQKVLSLPPDKPLKDEALFNIGLVYAHFGNPQRDLEKSLEFFKRLIKHFPRSSLVEQARIWVGILEENEKLNQAIQRIKQVDIEIEELRRKKAQ
jgi:tetratricopeptide (TPR) repeat protein